MQSKTQNESSLNRKVDWRSPLRYPGGKTKAAKFIAKHLPHSPIADYREPFCGGASVFLYLRRQGYLNSTSRMWLNDIYPWLIDFWKTAQRANGNLRASLRRYRDSFHTTAELRQYFHAT